ncbi:hypothetical protein [Sporolactobacillus terrae]|uniref:hypothetical protein n=1 Tax=Sporolactobacillus terrae TaxID=269673 RepID=UPI00049181BE|nr:hypothetical protein [Sporolactobacillus terrae]
MFNITFTVREILEQDLFTEWEISHLFPNENKYQLYCVGCVLCINTYEPVLVYECYDQMVKQQLLKSSKRSQLAEMFY